MPFDPDEFLKETDASFDPDAFLAETSTEKVDQAVLTYDSNQDPLGARAEVLSQYYYDPMDKDGELYHNKKLTSDQRIKELNKSLVASSQDNDLFEKSSNLDEYYLSLQNKQIKELLAAQRAYKSGAFKAKDSGYFEKLKKIKDDEIRINYINRSRILADAFKNDSEAYKSGLKGIANISNIAIGGAEALKHFPPYAALAEATGVDPIENFAKNLSKELNLLNESLRIGDELKEEWDKNKGMLWTRPDWLLYTTLENAPTMAVTMLSGKVFVDTIGKVGAAKELAVKLPTLKKTLDAMLYGSGSAFMESLSNAGDAVRQADAMGATDEQKNEIAGNVIGKDFLQSTVFNALQFGAGQFIFGGSNKGLNSFIKKVGAGVASALIESEQELRQDELQNREIAVAMNRGIENMPPELMPRIISMIHDPDKRDTGMYALFLGGLDPAMGFANEVKNTIEKTGRGKIKLDTLKNMSKNDMKKRLAELDVALDEKLEEETLTETDDPVGKKLQIKEQQINRQFEGREADIIRKNINDPQRASGELKILEAEKEVEILKINTVKGIYEDATIGADTKARIENMPDPTEQATAEEINEALKSVEDAQEYFQLRNEDIDALRKELGLKDIPKAAAVSLPDHIANAKAKGIMDNADIIAERVLFQKSDEAWMSPTERTGVFMKISELKTRFNDLMTNARELEKSGRKSMAKTMRSDALVLKLKKDILSEALKKTQSYAGSLLGSIRLKIDPKTMTLAEAIDFAETKRGEALPKDMEDTFVDLFSEIDKQEKEHKKLEKQETKFEKKSLKNIMKEAELFLKEAKQKAKESKRDLDSIAESIGMQENILNQKRDSISGLYDLDNETKGEIGIMAELYIEEAIANGEDISLQELADLLLGDFPGLEMQQVLDAFSGRTRKSIAQNKTNAELMLADLKKQAFLASKIMDAMDGVFDPFNPPSPDSDIVKALQNEFQELKNLNNKTTTDPSLKEFLKKKIDGIQDVLIQYERDGIIPIKKTKKVENAEIVKIRQESRELLSLLKTNQKIDELQNDMADMNKLQNVMKSNPRPLPENRQLYDSRLKLYHMRRVARGMIADAEKLSRANAWVRLASTISSLRLSGDLPNLRQLKYTMLNNPRKHLLNTMDALKLYKETLLKGHEAGDAAFSELMMQVENDPHYNEWVEVGLPLTDPKFGLTGREEAFLFAKYAEKIPVLGRFVAGSEYAYTSVINLDRIAYYESLREPGMSVAEKKMIANYVGTVTGRGGLGGLEQSSEAMAKWLISPRWYSANIQMSGGMFFTDKFWNSKTVRNAYIKDMGRLIATRAAFLAMGAGGGGDVEWTDTGSPNFWKLKIGKSVYDPWGGELWMPRMMIGMYQNPKKGWDIAGRQIRYKLHPGVSSILTIALGTEPTGMEVNRWWATFRVPLNLMTETTMEAIYNGNGEYLPYMLPYEFAGGSGYIKEGSKKSKNKRDFSSLD